MMSMAQLDRKMVWEMREHAIGVHPLAMCIGRIRADPALTVKNRVRLISMAVRAYEMVDNVALPN